VLRAKSAWVGFLAGSGAILLTFLTGAELDPGTFRTKWKDAMVVGLVGFFAPFSGSHSRGALPVGVVRSFKLAGRSRAVTTSDAVVYAVMLELGLNRTGFGKGILAACFVNDLGTVIALGLIFAPFRMGGLATWAGSEAVLPAYIIGMVLAGTVGKEAAVRRMLVEDAGAGE
jgi:glutathione-regulated potassium-efflux system ancillary protein KefC